MVVTVTSHHSLSRPTNQLSDVSQACYPQSRVQESGRETWHCSVMVEIAAKVFLLFKLLGASCPFFWLISPDQHPLVTFSPLNNDSYYHPKISPSFWSLWPRFWTWRVEFTDLYQRVRRWELRSENNHEKVQHRYPIQSIVTTIFSWICKRGARTQSAAKSNQSVVHFCFVVLEQLRWLAQSGRWVGEKCLGFCIQDEILLHHKRIEIFWIEILQCLKGFWDNALFFKENQ